MRFAPAPIDALLLLMTLIWGSNYSIVKAAFGEVPPMAFNAVRLAAASAIFLALIAAARRLARRGPPAAAPAVSGIFFTQAPLTPRDWLGLFGLGVTGHFVYQLCFIGGLARTSVANSSLILALTPGVVAVGAAALGQERVGRLHWAGILLSVAGIYLVVGRPPPGSPASLPGDALMMASVLCWSAYTVGARVLMARHSPLFVTGVSMAIGTGLYVPAAGGDLAAVDWAALSAGAWASIGFSAVFALCVSYMIWYIAVQRIGSTRTAMYSNLIPLVAMAVAVAWLGEPLSPAKVAGAALVLVGIALTRVGRMRAPAPAQE